jgi:thymidylate kinase
MAYALASGEEYYQAVVALTKGIPDPDLSVIIDITAEESFKRKWRPEDRESLDHDPVLLDKVRQCFLDLSKRFGWTVIDGMDGPDVVAERVLNLVSSTR